MSRIASTTGLGYTRIIGKRHLDDLVSEFSAYYNSEHSLMERDQLRPLGEESVAVETIKLNQLEVKSCVGGLVKSSERRAA